MSATVAFAFAFAFAVAVVDSEVGEPVLVAVESAVVAVSDAPPQA